MLMTYSQFSSSSRYCEGSSLEALYRKFGVMTEPLATRYIVQILEGLCFIHDRDIIHKDVKGMVFFIYSSSSISFFLSITLSAQLILLFPPSK